MTGRHRAMDAACTTDSPDYLRQRANRLRQVVRGVGDPRAVEELERFISELETRADELTRNPCGP